MIGRVNIIEVTIGKINDCTVGKNLKNIKVLGEKKDFYIKFFFAYYYI